MLWYSCLSLVDLGPCVVCLYCVMTFALFRTCNLLIVILQQCIRLLYHSLMKVPLFSPMINEHRKAINNFRALSQPIFLLLLPEWKILVQAPSLHLSKPQGRKVGPSNRARMWKTKLSELCSPRCYPSTAFLNQDERGENKIATYATSFYHSHLRI